MGCEKQDDLNELAAELTISLYLMGNFITLLEFFLLFLAPHCNQINGGGKTLHIAGGQWFLLRFVWFYFDSYKE